MKKKAVYFLRIGVAAWIAAANAASAAVIVDFNSANYTSSNFASMSGWTSGIASVPYSDSDYLYPAVNYDSSLPSAKFYGGAVTDGANGLTAYRVANGSGAWSVDNISVVSNSAGATVTQLVVWKQADFLALSSGYVAFASTTKVSLSLQAGTSRRSAAARLIIQQSGSYYVSEVIGTAVGTALSNISNVDPTQLDWFNYNPANLAEIGSSAMLPNLGGLTAVGIWAQGTVTASDTPAVSFGGLTINAAAVPEPGVAALAGLGLTVLITMGRRSCV